MRFQDSRAALPPKWSHPKAAAWAPVALAVDLGEGRWAPWEPQPGDGPVLPGVGPALSGRNTVSPVLPVTQDPEAGGGRQVSAQKEFPGGRADLCCSSWLDGCRHQ